MLREIPLTPNSCHMVCFMLSARAKGKIFAERVSLTDALQVVAAHPGGGGHLGWIYWDGHQDHRPLQGHSKDLLPPGA